MSPRAKLLRCPRGHLKVEPPSGRLVCRICDAERQRRRRSDPAVRDPERVRDRLRKRALKAAEQARSEEAS